MSMRGEGLPRLAMACWSHDWLLRRDMLGGEYSSLGRVLDELAARGYNALRVDAFPHLIGSRSDGVVLDRFQITSGRAPVDIQPRKYLLELATLAKARNIRLWLTSAFLQDSQSCRSFVRRPRDFVDVWSQTLSALEQQGLLDTVVAVDFCHEFTDPETTHGAFRSLFHAHPRSLMARLADWSKEAELAVEAYLQEVPRTLKALFPSVAFGVSATRQVELRLRKLDTSELDFIDSHLWLDDDPAISLLSATPLAHTGGRLGRGLQTRIAGLAWRARGTFWVRSIEQRIEGAAEFARIRRLQSVIGGGFVHLASEQQADWRWVKQVSESVLKASLAQGVSTIVTAHQARPQSPRLWADIDWHRDMTKLIIDHPPR
ncbi:MAG: cellulase [Gammaproteobacteria bacterium]|nr:cellulase [Gammaproteobacteria bacterium]MBQ0775612.1 cellulase [Gammaproteobacteria bacterium]